MGAIDFNADLGESFGLWERGADDELMQVISSANVACGFHAGDPATVRVGVETAADYGGAVGSHPGLPDRLGFGRRRIDVTPADVADYVLYQTGALRAFATAAGLRLHHVKPHGALYMMALDDAPLARAIVEAVARVDDGLPVYTLAGSEVWHAANAAGIQPVAEFFADRPMRRDGSVVMFGWQELFEPTPEAVAERVRELVTTGAVTSLEGEGLLEPTPEGVAEGGRELVTTGGVTSLEGEAVTVDAASVCVHSDTPGAGRIGPAVRAAIEGAGHSVSSELPADAQTGIVPG